MPSTISGRSRRMRRGASLARPACRASWALALLALFAVPQGGCNGDLTGIPGACDTRQKDGSCHQYTAEDISPITAFTCQSQGGEWIPNGTCPTEGRLSACTPDGGAATFAYSPTAKMRVGATCTEGYKTLDGGARDAGANVAAICAHVAKVCSKITSQECVAAAQQAPPTPQEEQCALAATGCESFAACGGGDGGAGSKPGDGGSPSHGDAAAGGDASNNGHGPTDSGSETGPGEGTTDASSSGGGMPDGG